MFSDLSSDLDVRLFRGSTESWAVLLKARLDRGGPLGVAWVGIPLKMEFLAFSKICSGAFDYVIFRRGLPTVPGVTPVFIRFCSWFH